jgi:Ca2+:H+ antiporter
VIKNSVAQIAVFLFPILVLLSLFFAEDLTFVLNPVYIGALVIMALAMWQITGDGEAVAFEGWALVVLYLILAVVTFYE